jgi:hypothetical protein
MWADTEDELFEMVDKIGVNRKHLQQPPKAKWTHFDICQQKRKLAIKFGAKVTDKYGALEHVARLKGQEFLLRTIENLREKWRK